MRKPQVVAGSSSWASTVTDDGVVVVALRGKGVLRTASVPAEEFAERLRADAAEAREINGAPPPGCGPTWKGSFPGRFAREGEPQGFDRIKGAADGARSMIEIAWKLRARAEWYEQMARAGAVLADVVEDDYVVFHKPPVTKREKRKRRA